MNYEIKSLSFKNFSLPKVYVDSENGILWIPLNEIVAILTPNTAEQDRIFDMCIENGSVSSLLFHGVIHVNDDDFRDFLQQFQLELNLNNKALDNVMSLLRCEPFRISAKRKRLDEEEFEQIEEFSSENEEDDPTEVMEEQVEEEEEELPNLNIDNNCQVLRTLAYVAAIPQLSEELRTQVEEQISINLNLLKSQIPGFAEDQGEFVGIDEWMRQMNLHTNNLTMEIRKKVGREAAKFYRQQFGRNPPKIRRTIDGVSMLTNKYTEKSAPYSLEPAIDKSVLKERD